MTTDSLSGSSARSFDQADIADLRGRVRGDVHRPTDPGYPTVGFNPAVSRRPWAVIDVLDATDVAGVVAFATENAMTVAVHATGHGATLVDGHKLLVRTTLLDTCEIDPAARTARIGAGVRWQTVIEAAAAHGLAPVCGSAPGVGVVGLLTGGGIGPLVRSLGASSDHVRSFEVITGSGEHRRVSPTENAEMFWGLRGGKATLASSSRRSSICCRSPRYTVAQSFSTVRTVPRCSPNGSAGAPVWPPMIQPAMRPRRSSSNDCPTCRGCPRCWPAG